MSRHARPPSELVTALKLVLAVWVPVWLFLTVWTWTR